MSALAVEHCHVLGCVPLAGRGIGGHRRLDRRQVRIGQLFAEPGSDSREKLELLRVIGTQDLSVR